MNKVYKPSKLINQVKKEDRIRTVADIIAAYGKKGKTNETAQSN